MARSSAKGQSRVRSKDKAELLARTKWISVFLFHAKKFGDFPEGQR